MHLLTIFMNPGARACLQTAFACNCCMSIFLLVCKCLLVDLLVGLSVCPLPACLPAWLAGWLPVCQSVLLSCVRLLPCLFVFLSVQCLLSALHAVYLRGLSLCVRMRTVTGSDSMLDKVMDRVASSVRSSGKCLCRLCCQAWQRTQGFSELFIPNPLQSLLCILHPLSL